MPRFGASEQPIMIETAWGQSDGAKQMVPIIRSVLGRLGVKRKKPELPLAGWIDGRVATPLVEQLSDAELAELNALLPWNCFTVDGKGRRFGFGRVGGQTGCPTDRS